MLLLLLLLLESLLILSVSANHWIHIGCRGRILLPAFWDKLSNDCPEVEGLKRTDGAIEGSVKVAEGFFKEVKEFHYIAGWFWAGTKIMFSVMICGLFWKGFSCRFRRWLRVVFNLFIFAGSWPVFALKNRRARLSLYSGMLIKKMLGVFLWLMISYARSCVLIGRYVPSTMRVMLVETWNAKSCSSMRQSMHGVADWLIGGWIDNVKHFSASTCTVKTMGKQSRLHASDVMIDVGEWPISSLSWSWSLLCVRVQEERSRQPSLFTVVRAAVELFYYNGDPQLGLYGAFGWEQLEIHHTAWVYPAICGIKQYCIVQYTRKLCLTFTHDILLRALRCSGHSVP